MQLDIGERRVYVEADGLKRRILGACASSTIEGSKRIPVAGMAARRPKFLFSGLAKCTACGGGYVTYWQRLACFNARGGRGTCTTGEQSAVRRLSPEY
jgi:hypothetical protein